MTYGFCDADVRREFEQTLVADYYAVVEEEVTKHGNRVGFGIQEVWQKTFKLHQSASQIYKHT